MTKVTYSAGWDAKRGKYRYSTGEIVNYLLNEVVEVKTKTGKIIRLYKQEYAILND